MNQPARIDAEHEQPARFSVEEFMAIAAEGGPLGDYVGKIELVEGVIVRMSPANNPHFYFQRRLFVKLHAIFGDGLDGWIVGSEPTIRLGVATVRDPDVAILRDLGLFEGLIGAADVLLVAEISDSSLAVDRSAKRLSYARAGIAHYWVVDIRGRTVETMREPADGDYRVRETTAFGEDMPVPGSSASIRID